MSVIAKLKLGQVSRVTGQENDEFHEFVKFHRDEVFGFVSRRVSPIEEAEDVTAKVFCEALQGWRKHKPIDARLWVFKIARRRVLDSWRANRRRVGQLNLEVRPHPETPADRLEVEQAIDTVRQAVFALPEAQREVILLQAVEGLSVKEISAIVGRSVDAVSSLLQRARATLNKSVTQDEVSY